MEAELKLLANCLFGAIVLAGILGLALGILSAFWPKRSIDLYIRIMAFFNWRVSPMDEVREIKNTRRLGVILILLSAVIFLFLI